MVHGGTGLDQIEPHHISPLRPARSAYRFVGHNVLQVEGIMSALTTESPEDIAALEAGKHVLCIMDRTGDTRIMWDPHRPDEVATAKSAFDEAIKRGMRAYAVDEEGQKGEQIKKWDATKGKIIMAPALVGG